MSTPTPTTFTPVRCADVTPAAVSWLWEPYLARGKLAILDGDPGTGKSFVTVDLAARISAGAPLPGGAPGAPGSVLLLNAEDDARDTIRPRVAAAGGDPDRVHIFAAPGLGMVWSPAFPDDIRQLERAVRELSAALVVIDPLTAFLAADVNVHSDHGVRAALWPFAALAADTGACVLLVRHLRKAGGASAVYRGAGSIGIVGTVRTGLMIARHPDDPELRVLTLSKTNIGPPGQSLGFRLARREADGQTVVNWAGPLDVSADDLFGTSVSARAGSRPRERAAEWLREFLAAGPRRAPEVQDAAHVNGIPDRTLTRVKAAVGVQSEARNCGGKVEWWWSDPAAERARDRAGRRELREAAELLRPRPRRRDEEDEEDEEDED